MRLAYLLILPLILWFPAAALRADDPPAKAKELLEKALRAHGGETAMVKLLTAEWSGRGLAYRNGDEEHAIPFYADWQAALPSRCRYVFKFRGLGANLPVITALDGDKAWRSYGDTRGGEDLVEKRLKEEQEDAYALYVARLVPLLSGDFKLTPLPIGGREGRYVLGLKVEQAGHRPNYLYFDKRTGYLSHQERTVYDVEQHKELLQTTTYQNFKPLGGAILPQSHTIKRGGKLFMELEISKVEPKQALDEKLFIKPIEKDKP